MQRACFADYLRLRAEGFSYLLFSERVVGKRKSGTKILSLNLDRLPVSFGANAHI